MKRTEAFPPTYLNQKDLPRPHVAIVKAVGREMMTCNDGGEQEKPVLHFQNGTKPLVLNMVNWQKIEQTYGEDSDDWIGKPVELYVDPNIMYGRDRVGGIRIRIPAGDTAPINFEKAIEMAKGIGRSREDLVGFLKSKGRVGYNHARDAELVREFIAGNSHEQIKEEDVPF